jgi:diadenosine tetraphosphate (Ap4A) HIT family hydrolase
MRISCRRRPRRRWVSEDAVKPVKTCAAGLLLFLALALGDVRNCTCDIASAESMAKRECGLCREAEKQPVDTSVFFVQDINPNKPHRWLALPRAHAHTMADLTEAQRRGLWTAAIGKAHEVWGDDWGLAANADSRRSQCHVHAHIGKLLEGVETADFTVVDGPADIPAPKDAGGIWIHPAGGKLHVHLGEDAPETLLMR